MADVDPAIREVAKGVPLNTWINMECSGGKSLTCTTNTSSKKMRVYCALINSGLPSDITPFATTYENHSDQMANTALVWSRAGGTGRKPEFCLVVASDRSAECLLNCASECQTKQGLYCP